MGCCWGRPKTEEIEDIQEGDERNKKEGDEVTIVEQCDKHEEDAVEPGEQNDVMSDTMVKADEQDQVENSSDNHAMENKESFQIDGAGSKENKPTCDDIKYHYTEDKIIDEDEKGKDKERAKCKTVETTMVDIFSKTKELCHNKTDQIQPKHKVDTGSSLVIPSGMPVIENLVLEDLEDYTEEENENLSEIGPHSPETNPPVQKFQSSENNVTAKEISVDTAPTSIRETNDGQEEKVVDTVEEKQLMAKDGNSFRNEKTSSGSCSDMLVNEDLILEDLDQCVSEEENVKRNNECGMFNKSICSSEQTKKTVLGELPSLENQQQKDLGLELKILGSELKKAVDGKPPCLTYSYRATEAVKKRSRQLEERLSELEHRQIEESKKRIAAQKTNKRALTADQMMSAPVLSNLGNVHHSLLSSKTIESSASSEQTERNPNVPIPDVQPKESRPLLQSSQSEESENSDQTLNITKDRFKQECSSTDLITTDSANRFCQVFTATNIVTTRNELDEVGNSINASTQPEKTEVQSTIQPFIDVSSHRINPDPDPEDAKILKAQWKEQKGELVERQLRLALLLFKEEQEYNTEMKNKQHKSDKT